MARAGGENMNEPRPESILRLNVIGMGVSRAAVSIKSLSPIGDTSYFPALLHLRLRMVGWGRLSRRSIAVPVALPTPILSGVLMIFRLVLIEGRKSAMVLTCCP